MTVRWKPGSWGAVKSAVYSDRLTCQPVSATPVWNPGKLIYQVQGQKPSVPGSELGLHTDARGGFGQLAIYSDAGANTRLPLRAGEAH